MKRIILTLALLATLNSLHCQLVTSREGVIWDNPGSNANLIRVYGNNKGNIIHSYSNTIPHTFYYTLTPPLYYEYDMPPMANPQGTIGYTVNDMRVDGEYLYFCGKMSFVIASYYVPGVGWWTDYVNKGYLAKMKLDDISSLVNPSVWCDFSTIDGTTDLSKIAVQVAPNDTLIAMVGMTDHPLAKSCLVTVRGTSTSWLSNVFAMPDTTEVLTDVILGGKYLVTASRFGGETHTFGVRYAYIPPLFHNNDYSEFQYLNKFNTVNMHRSSDNVHPTWHTNNVNIRLVADPYSNDVTVAHEGRWHWVTYMGIPTYTKYVVFYYINGANPYNIYMQDAKCIVGFQQDAEAFMDIAYIPRKNQLAVLQMSHTNDNFASIITFYSWSSYTHDMIYTVKRDHVSLDVSDEKVWACGNVRGQDSVVFFYQNVDYPTRTCMWPSDVTSSKLEEIPDPIRSATDIDWYVYNKLITWTYRYSVTPTLNEYNRTCKTFLEDLN